MAERVPDALADTLAAKAMALLAALSDGQRAQIEFPFPDDEQRRDWAYFPRDHAGLPFHDMHRDEQKLAHALIAAALSLPAYAKVTAIMALESVLNRLEDRRLDHWRDPGRYFFSIFGEPGPEQWGFRLEGHHVCLNFTFAGGRLLSETPLFLGANPAAVYHRDTPVVRPCGQEEDAGRELLHSLDPSQREIAVLTAVAPLDFVLGNAPVVPYAALPGETPGFPSIQDALRSMSHDVKEALAFHSERPAGLPAARMTDAQRGLLRGLVRVYVERLPDARAAERLAEIEAGFEGLHFAWAGGEHPGEGHYYRIQGESLLIEYDCTQDGANHVHAVWRDTARDFGGDALHRHLAQAHQRQ